MFKPRVYHDLDPGVCELQDGLLPHGILDVCVPLSLLKPVGMVTSVILLQNLRYQNKHIKTVDFHNNKILK